MKKIYKLLLLSGVFMFASCELDYLNSPNDVPPSAADVNYILNRVQIDFANFYQGTQTRGAEVTRINHAGGNSYEIANPGSNHNGTWGTAYADILQDIKVVKELATTAGFRRHLGIAKTLEAYVLMVLVDQFGDVPYSEALDPAEFNPVADDDASVYAAALALLQDAKADFSAATTLGTPNDYFYGNNATKWLRLINTLELRYHLSLRLTNAAASTSAIAALVTANNFLQVGDDFVFPYGKNQADPNSRHPDFVGQYPNGGGDYQSTYFMWHVTEGKKTTPGDATEPVDPRANYYFYRQSGSNPTLSSEKECIAEFPPSHYPAGMPWCMPGVRGYWGRDHLDPDGIPPDGLRRTLWGVYPAGHIFDDNTPGGMTAAKTGNTGGGIAPIMLAAYVDFMLAEADLMLGTGANANALLLSGVQKHVDFVRAWSLTTTESAKITTFQSTTAFNTKRTTFLSRVDAQYDAATSNTDRLRIIAREYWISLFGNGNEAYNLYRRTGMPDNMQPGQVTTIGDFPRTFLYPTDFVVRNNTVDQKENHNVQVFWDNNPAGFIK